MSAISTEYAKRSKTPIIRVKLTTFFDGQDPGVYIVGNDIYPEVISCDINYGLDQTCTSCTLVLKLPTDAEGNYIELKPMNRVEIKQGWNTEETLRVTFFGFVDKVEYSRPPQTVTLECRDLLKLTENMYYIHSNRRVYSATEDDTELDAYGYPMGGQDVEDRQVQNILTDFLTDSGLPEDRLYLDFEEYPASGALIIGNNATAVFEYESAADAINRVCDLVGYRLWADKAGNVQCREIRPIASESVAQTYRDQIETYSGNGVWTVETEGNLIECNITTDDDLRNWVEVYGWNDEVSTTVYGDSDYIPNPPTYRKTEIRSYLLDTPELVLAVAERVYDDLNRLRYTATATIEGDPRLEIGQTIAINDAFATGGLDYNFFLYDFSSTFRSGSWTMDLTLVGGAGDNMEGSEPIDNRAPVAMFSSNVEREYLYYDGTPTAVSDVWVDASSSYDPDGNEDNLSYVWEVGGFPNYSGVTHHYVVSGVDALVVKLTVYDDGAPSLSSSLEQTINFPTSSGIGLRTIFVATTNQVWVSSTGGFIWLSRELY